MQATQRPTKFGKQLCSAVTAYVLVVTSVAWFVLSGGQHQLIEAQALRIGEIVGKHTSAARSTYAVMAAEQLQQMEQFKNDGTVEQAGSLIHNQLHSLPSEFMRILSEDTQSVVNPMYTFKPISEWNQIEPQRPDNEFQQWAWSELKKQDKTDPGEPISWQSISRVDSIDGKPVLRFMAADPASSDACVYCHNKLEQQPEFKQRRIDAGLQVGREWSKHELLGAFQVDIPLQQPLAAAKNQATSGFLIVLAVTLIGAASVGFFFYVDSIRKQAASRRFERQAKQDYLTGLSNRLHFEAELGRYLGSEPTIKQSHSVMLLDLNNFKDINDSLGHAAGDSVLIEVAQRLKKTLRSTDLVARLGGDEFAILLPCSGCSVARSFADKISVSISQPLLLNKMSLSIGVSIGITVTKSGDTQPRELLRRADMAMYKAKREQHSFSEYDSDEDHNGLSALELVIDLKQAIEEDMLELHFQPKYDLRQWKMVGAEALLRWTHPTHGDLKPDYIVAAAERSGLMPALTYWAMKNALRECKNWHAAGFKLSVAVNLGAASLNDPNLVQHVFEILDQAQMPPGTLVLEVTESQVMSNPEQAEITLQTLHSLGIKVSLDDYGAGYSSLAYLNRLPISELKLDKSFLCDLFNTEKNRVIVNATVMLARNLNLTLVCEGVEDAKTLAFLCKCDCDQVQGQYLSFPLPKDLFLRKLPAMYQLKPAASQPDVIDFA